MVYITRDVPGSMVYITQDDLEAGLNAPHIY